MLRRKIKRKPKAKTEEKVENPPGITDPEVAQVQKAKRQRLDSASSAKGVYKTNRSRKTSENVETMGNQMITEKTTIRETTIKMTTIKSPESTINTTGSITTSIGARSPNSTIENEFTEATTIPAVIQTLPPVQEILNISNPENASFELSSQNNSLNSPNSTFQTPEIPQKFNTLPLTEIRCPSPNEFIINESIENPRMNYDNFDAQSVTSAHSQNSQASTTSTTYRRYRAQEVKSKLKAMKKDDDGQVIIDKDEFPLADLIYVSRYVGTKKTGLQIKRENLEAKKRQSIIDREAELKIKQENEANDGETGEKDDKSDPSSDSKIKDAITKTEAHVVVSELTEMQQSMKNRENIDKVLGMTKINEKGELVVDSNQLVESHPDKKKDFERDLGFDEVDAMNNYKRCYQKRCTGKARRWRETENSLFWEALAIVGQDFQLMESYFQGKQVRRNKAELKSKFSREDKAQRSLVNECLKKASLRPLAMNDFITKIEVIPAVASDGNNNLEMAK